MKIKHLILVLSGLLIVHSGYSQFAFGVSPGLKLNSAYFGYQVNERIVPYVGFQYLRVQSQFTETGERYDFNAGQLVSYTNENSFSANLFIPTVGAKGFFLKRDNLSAYFSLAAMKPFISGKFETTTGNAPNNQFEDDLNNLSIWGGEFGFGIEYFFDDHFSLGGEYGMRYFNFRYSDSYTSTITVPFPGGGFTTQQTEIEADYALNISPTFSKFSLNYYF